MQSEGPKLDPVKARQSPSRSDPEVAIPSLRQRVNRVLRQTVLGLPRPNYPIVRCTRRVQTPTRRSQREYKKKTPNQESCAALPVFRTRSHTAYHLHFQWHLTRLKDDQSTFPEAVAANCPHVASVDVRQQNLAVLRPKECHSAAVSGKILFEVTRAASLGICLAQQIHDMGPTSRLLASLLLVSLTACGCVSKKSRQGVENRWRGENAPVFKQGQTTEHDVLTALGPPSQLINLGNQTVFYYLQEQKQARSLILILYNQTREKISYDRAIFFFDQQGRLTHFARSDEQNPAK